MKEKEKKYRSRASGNYTQFRLKESQNTELKEEWRDEALKSICAFANSQGGGCACWN